MRVLIACEFSGIVRDAFLARGHDAWSCDLLQTERERERHIVGDVTTLLDRGWDLMVAHPPCTYLANSGVHWLSRRPERMSPMEQAAHFFRLLLGAPIHRVAVENPVMHRYAVAIVGRKHDQTIQPYEFGHPESKRTCLWLRNLPTLRATKILPLPVSRKWENQTPSGQNKLGPSAERWKLRSRSYAGIAKAMAEQWGFL